MEIKEFTKYVLDNMYRASLTNSLNITKKFCNMPYPLNLTEGNNTAIYSFREFLVEIDKSISERLDAKSISKERGYSICVLCHKYLKLYDASYKGELCYKKNDLIFEDEQCTKNITPKENNRYYDITSKKSFDYINNKFNVVKVMSYQLHMIVDGFIMELWRCYQ